MYLKYIFVERSYFNTAMTTHVYACFFPFKKNEAISAIDTATVVVLPNIIKVSKIHLLCIFYMMWKNWRIKIFLTLLFPICVRNILITFCTEIWTWKADYFTHFISTRDKKTANQLFLSKFQCRK